MGTVSAVVLRGDAAHLPLPDGSVDLICTSPPYFGLRSYSDGGEAYDGQIGSEYTPWQYLEALWQCTAEWMRVLKPSGSIFVNLGDKYSTYTGANWGNGRSLDGYRGQAKVPHGGPVNAPEVYGIPYKSLMGLPWRYVLGCIGTGSALDSAEVVKLLLRDVALGVISLAEAEQVVDELAVMPAPGLGLILRAEIIWNKPSGMPESATDRVRRCHEQVFHFVKQPRYYSAVNEIREPHAAPGRQAGTNAFRARNASLTRSATGDYEGQNPLGKMPGSVWEIAAQPLMPPPHLGVDHFAAFPMELPRRIILGWSPSGICVECDEGRQPVASAVALDMTRPQARRAQQLADQAGLTEAHLGALLSVGISDTGRGAATQNGTGRNTAEVYALAAEARAALGGYAREYLLRRPTGFGYACGCTPFTDHPERRGKDFHAGTDRPRQGMNDGNGGARYRRYVEELANPRGPVREYHLEDWTPPPTRPAVVVDPFGGTGTTALVADVLGRIGITVDRSMDYARLARWRTRDPAERARALGVPKPPPVPDGQGSLFDATA